MNGLMKKMERRVSQKRGMVSRRREDGKSEGEMVSRRMGGW